MTTPTATPSEALEALDYFLRHVSVGYEDHIRASVLRCALSASAQGRPPKPAECANGCPPRQVCDHCQWPPAQFDKPQGETPRTDAMWAKGSFTKKGAAIKWARQLERELAELTTYKACTELALLQVYRMFEPPLVGTVGLKVEITKLREAAQSATAATIAPPTQDEIAAYREIFRSELDKRMDTNHPSASPSTEAHAVALRSFVDTRNLKGGSPSTGGEK